MSTAKTTITYDGTGIRTGLSDIDGSLRTALDDVRDNMRLGLVGVSADATHIGTLEELLLAGSGISLSTQNGGGDETRTIDATVDGIDIDATAGEALAILDMVYLNPSDGEWYKQDSDASATVAMGRVRGCVVEVGGIAEDVTGKVRILGEVSGFTSLIAWDKVYASATAGGYTQTKPFTSSSGTQIIVSEMGYAISSTVIWIEPQELSYRKRGVVADSGTLSLEHHVDESVYERDIAVLVDTTIAGSSLTSHTESNKDAHHPIQGSTGTSAGTQHYDISGTGSIERIGNYSGTDYAISNRVNLQGGALVRLAFEFGATTGSPTGTVTWEIRDGTTSSPSATVLVSGTFTPVASSTVYVDVPEDTFMVQKDHHFVLKSTSLQSSGNYWTWARPASAGSEAHYYSTDNGSSWSYRSDVPMAMSSLVVDSSDKTKLAQSFQIGSTTNVGMVKLYLLKIGSPTGDLSIRIVNDDTGNPDETPSLEATSIALSATTLTTSWAWHEFIFDIPPSLSNATTYWIVLETTDSQSATDYVTWAFQDDTPSYASGEFQQYEGIWSVTSVGDAIFDVLEEGTTYISQALLDDWGSALATYLVRLDDGTGSNDATQTTIKNNTGSEATVELAVTFERGEL